MKTALKFIALTKDTNSFISKDFIRVIDHSSSELLEFIFETALEKRETTFLSFGPKTMSLHSFLIGNSSIMSMILSKLVDSSIEVRVRLSNSTIVLPCEPDSAFIIHSCHDYELLFDSFHQFSENDLMKCELFFDNNVLVFISLPSFPPFKSSISERYVTNGWKVLTNPSLFVKTEGYALIHIDPDLHYETQTCILLPNLSEQYFIENINKPIHRIELSVPEPLNQENIDSPEETIPPKKNKVKKSKIVRRSDIKSNMRIIEPRSSDEIDDQKHNESGIHPAMDGLDMDKESNNEEWAIEHDIEEEDSANVNSDTDNQDLIINQIHSFVANIDLVIPALSDDSIYSKIHQRLLFEKWKNEVLSKIYSKILIKKKSIEGKFTDEIASLRKLVLSNDLSLFLYREEQKLKLLEEKYIEALENMISLKRKNYEFNNVPGLFNTFRSLTDKEIMYNKTLRMKREEIRKITIELNIKQIGRLSMMEKYHQQALELANLKSIEKKLQESELIRDQLFDEIQQLEEVKESMLSQKNQVLNKLDNFLMERQKQSKKKP